MAQFSVEIRRLPGSLLGGNQQAVLVYLSSPTYIMPLFTTSIGHIVLGVSGFWMLIGVLVMRQMINFDV